MKRQTKKPPPKPEEAEEEQEEVPAKGLSLYAVDSFKTRLTWGVKDRAGEWIISSIVKSNARKVFDSDPEAFQLIEGCDPWACLDDSPVTLTVREEKPDVPTPEAVHGAGAA